MFANQAIFVFGAVRVKSLKHEYEPYYEKTETSLEILDITP